jgi:hypothetical protein
VDTTESREIGATANLVSTKRLKVGDLDIAYRTVGTPGAFPLVLLQRFRGTLDDWDPARRSGSKAPGHLFR